MFPQSAPALCKRFLCGKWRFVFTAAGMYTCRMSLLAEETKNGFPWGKLSAVRLTDEGKGRCLMSPTAGRKRKSFPSSVSSRCSSTASPRGSIFRAVKAEKTTICFVLQSLSLRPRYASVFLCRAENGMAFRFTAARMYTCHTLFSERCGWEITASFRLKHHNSSFLIPNS